MKSAKDQPWQRAAAFAARAHRHQERQDGDTPYFSHCARVAVIVAMKFGCDDETAIAAAFLHDTIEDTPTDYDDIEREFGRVVAQCVGALTKNHALPEAARERDYDQRLRGTHWQARLVKLADAYDNWCDARTAPKRIKARKMCKRAVALAQQDARTHVPTRTAIALISRVI